jgi:pimeloyl-ACP methyl ester carboxylesterase
MGGQGKPLVLCHGFLSSAEEFGGRFRALASRRRLIVPDLPGNAASAPLPCRHTAEAMADCVDELLTRLEVDAFDLGGLCLGASVACALARRRGEAVGRLVLHTPLLTPGLVRARYRYQVRVMTLPGVWQGVTWLSRRRTISDLYKRYVIREGPIDRQTSDINFENQRRADLDAAREWLCDALERDNLALITRRTEPTLIIVSANDLLVDVAGLQRLVEGLPYVTMYVDEESGHGWNKAAVQRHLAVLEAFFSEQTEAAGQ